ncbi:protein kinase family protein [Intrasporangium flavum]|uniref:protein kinase family protein n=1 Tax=Intrasporangium flavum TaxID=1428657 RepID=UPI00096C025F|nr:protein kinase family protein [Intrasporangium flavum]
MTLRTSEGEHHERWRASDHTLEREVVVVVFPSGSPVAAPALDAARRAAGIEDPRLVRVLDVGTDQGVGFIVEEPLTGALPLSHLLQMGGLSADEVRRLTGEAATALDKASHRGLHHLALTPSSVLRMPDGEVKVRGLASEAALTGADRLSDERASRADAVGLVKIAYAGLTGRWPLVAVDGGLIPAGGPVGLETAPTIVGGVAAPSEIAVGVPNDLDLICRMTLGGGHRGPVSPGDLALQIAPWPSQPPASDGASGIRLTPTKEDFEPTRVLPAVTDLGAGAMAVGAAAGAGYGASTASGAGEDTAAFSPFGADPTSDPFADPYADPYAGDATAAYAPAGDRTEEMPHAVAGASALSTSPASAHTQFLDRPADATSDGSRATGEDRDESATARAQAGIAAAGAAAVGVAGTIGDKVGSFARAAADKAAAKAAERRNGHDDFEGEDIHLSDALDEAPTGRLEPPVPVFGRDTPERPSGAQSRIALAVVGVLVLIGLFVGISNVAKIGQHDGPSGSAGTVTVTQTRKPSQSQGGSTTQAPPSTTNQAPPATAVAITSGKGYDEQDGTESDRLAKDAFDGDPSTGWQSRWYGTDDYNGNKDGLGLILTLNQPTQVKEVTLVLPAAQDVTVYATTGDSRTGAQEVGSQSGAQGTVTIKASGDLQPATKLIVFITKAAPAEAPKHFRAQINEVTVR